MKNAADLDWIMFPLIKIMLTLVSVVLAGMFSICVVHGVHGAWNIESVPAKAVLDIFAATVIILLTFLVYRVWTTKMSGES